MESDGPKEAGKWERSVLYLSTQHHDMPDKGLPQSWDMSPVAAWSGLCRRKQGGKVVREDLSSSVCENRLGSSVQGRP